MMTRIAKFELNIDLRCRDNKGKSAAVTAASQASINAKAQHFGRGGRTQHADNMRTRRTFPAAAREPHGYNLYPQTDTGYKH
eukprot:3383998-Prymnesium_polylepis.1